MQVQKENIRLKIIEAATEEFLNNSYRNASLRNMATAANITPGNIYRYFESKSQLFGAVVEPAWQGLHSLFANHPLRDSNMSSNSIAHISLEITKVFVQYQRQFIILIKENNDSPLGDAKETITALVTAQIYEDLINKIPPEKKDTVIIEAMAVSITEAIIHIFKAFENDEAQLNKRIYIVTQVILKNIQNSLSIEACPC